MCAAASHKVLRYRLSPYMLLCLAGMAINSLLTLDWCTLCVVIQIHPTSLCSHLFLHAGTHPTNHLMLVSLPASDCASCFPHPKEGDGLADTDAMSCRGSTGRWASTEREKERGEEIFFPPLPLCDHVHFSDFYSPAPSLLHPVLYRQHSGGSSTLPHLPLLQHLNWSQVTAAKTRFMLSLPPPPSFGFT